MRSMSLVVDLIDLVTKHKSGELRCPATALFFFFFFFFFFTLVSEIMVVIWSAI